MEKVVITGIGMVNSLGETPEQVWNNILNKKVGYRKLKGYDINKFPPLKDYAYGYEYDISENMIEKCKNKFVDPRKLEKYPLAALYSSITAMEDSKFDIENNKNGCLIMCSSIGSVLERIERSVYLTKEQKEKYKLTRILTAEIGYPTGLITGYFGLTGPNINMLAACASGLYSTDYAMKMILNDDVDFAVVVASEVNTEPYMLHMFNISGALAKHNDEKTCRPLDKKRTGMMVGDGSVCFILEKQSNAEKRNAKIYGVIDAIGIASDDYHMTSPSKHGAGIRRCLDMLFRKTKLTPKDYDYINVHGTGTVIGDQIEYNTLNEFFPHAICNAYKANFGHLTSTSAGTEMGMCLLGMNNDIISGTTNVDEPLDGDLKILIENENINFNRFIKCSFGFGGKCAIISVSKYK